MAGKEDRIIIIGPYPPPYGGISVHVKRMTQLLNKDEYVLFNTSKTKVPGAVDFYGKKKYLLMFRLAVTRGRLIHSHATDSLLRILLGITGIFRKHVYLHIHGESLTDYLKKKNPGAFLMKKLVRYLNILACNSRLLERLSPLKPRSIVEADAYLPPVFDASLLDDYLKEYHSFLNSGRFIISMTGWFSYYQGEDLYGFDLAARALKRLIDEGKKASLVLTVNGIKSRELYESFLEYLSQNGLEEYVLMIHKDLPEAWPVFLTSQVFLRPTNTDGAAVSIKEALWAHTPVIASDCIVRPEHVLLFKNRSADELYHKIVYLYQKPALEQAEKVSLIAKGRNKCFLIDEIYGL